jgi:hypothetical protein
MSTETIIEPQVAGAHAFASLLTNHITGAITDPAELAAAEDAFFADAEERLVPVRRDERGTFVQHVDALPYSEGM